MKKFLITVSAALIALFALASIADFIVSKGLSRADKGPHYTFNRLMNERMDNDVVILGNSRAQCSYCPSVIDSVLGSDSRNLGVSGQPFGVSNFRWSLYRQNNDKPRLVIINMDYMELSVNHKGVEREQYYPYVNDPRARWAVDANEFSWLDRNCPMYRYRGDFKLVTVALAALAGKQLFSKWDSNLCKGYVNVDSPWDGTEFARQLAENDTLDWACEPEAVEMLDSLCNELKSDSIAAVFVYAPIYEEVLAHLNQEVPMAAYRAISERYGIPMLDYTDMGLCSDSTSFYNANHINDKSARSFSRQLAEDIASMGIFAETNEAISEQLWQKQGL